MLEGVDRLIDLVGLRTSHDVTQSRDMLLGAIRAGDTRALAAVGGQFAGTVRDGQTVRLARTIGVPLRYFVAKMYHGPFLVVSDRMDRIFDWCQGQRIGWQFEPSYTRMIPAHYLVELDQVGCPDPMPRYRRFFEPAVATGPADVEAIGAAYVRAAYEALHQWIAAVPAGEPIGVAFSGGVDSTSVWLLARHAASAQGRNPDDVRAFTLDLGGGADAAQAEQVAHALGLERSWERIAVPESEYDLRDAIATIEDYHPLDVECAAAALCLLRGIRERYPSLRYLVDGDGGDENLKAYPLEDSDLTLSSILRNPLLYQEGWGIDAIKHSLAYTGGLSRGYVRTFAPAARYGFTACSPYATRPAIAAAVAIPFEQVLGGSAERLMTLKQDVLAAGVKAVTGVEMPVRPKRRFQDGAHAVPRARVTKAWCQRVFDEMWQERLREADADANTRRSGNEMSVPVPLRYPESAAARDRFVLDLRGPKAVLDPHRASAAVWEEERDESGALAPTAVVFLTNRECPFRCAMCDLWVNTLDEAVPRGAIARQIREALATLPPARQIKLYNAGSFFDPQAIPFDDYEEIAATVAGFDRVIVEAHPAFLRGPYGDACRRLRDLVGGRLEVAVGLETVHQEALAALNKRMTLDDFAEAAAFLARHAIALRVFVLLDPPFVPHHEAAEWALSSVRTGRRAGASVCAVIPTRGGNGAIDLLPVEQRPRLGLRDLEWVVQEALADSIGGPEGSPLRARMRVFADLWDVERIFDCQCSRERAARLARMNREQVVPPPVACACDGR